MQFEFTGIKSFNTGDENQSATAVALDICSRSCPAIIFTDKPTYFDRGRYTTSCAIQINSEKFTVVITTGSAPLLTPLACS